MWGLALGLVSGFLVCSSPWIQDLASLHFLVALFSSNCTFSTFPCSTCNFSFKDLQRLATNNQLAQTLLGYLKSPLLTLLNQNSSIEPQAVFSFFLSFFLSFFFFFFFFLDKGKKQSHYLPNITRTVSTPQNKILLLWNTLSQAIMIHIALSTTDYPASASMAN